MNSKAQDKGDLGNAVQFKLVVSRERDTKSSSIIL